MSRDTRLSTVLRRSMVGADGPAGDVLRAAALACARDAEDDLTPAAARTAARREAVALWREYDALLAAGRRVDVVGELRRRVG